MVDFKTAMQGLLTRGYGDENVEERLAQEILLKALADCGLRENVTIKGGVVMANLTRDMGLIKSRSQACVIFPSYPGTPAPPAFKRCLLGSW